MHPMNSWKSAYVRARQAAFLAKHPYLDLYVLDGFFKGTPLSVLVADDGSTMPYIRSVAFPDGSDIYKKGRISALKSPSLALSNADVVVVGANQMLCRLFSRRGFHIVPKWLCPVLHTSGEHPDVIINKLGKSARSDIKHNLNKANKAGFSYEVTTDPEWAESFYYYMYKPYAERRHNALLQLDSYSKIKTIFKNGAGIILKRNGETVGGSIFYMQGKTMRNPYMGILDGEESAVHSGAAQVLYYYAMLVAHSRECKAINFGSSRPFLSDGVLRLKMRWDMDVTADDMATAAFAIITPHHTEAAMKFLSANPFFEIIGGKLQLYKPDFQIIESAAN